MVATAKPERTGAEVWTVKDVAAFLRCSDDKAAKWLVTKSVPRYDIGEGRGMIRVLQADVKQTFYDSAMPIAPATRTAAANRRGRVGYVPKYAPAAVTPRTRERRPGSPMA